MNNIRQNYFVYRGIKYGKGTKIRFTRDFYLRLKQYRTEVYRRNNPNSNFTFSNTYYREPEPSYFHYINIIDNKEEWICGSLAGTEMEIIPDRDIQEILYAVYYFDPLSPKELVKVRLKNGTWFDYIWKQTLFYVVCLLISPLFKQWYLIWTIGLYAYLRLCYIALSKQ